MNVFVNGYCQYKDDLVNRSLWQLSTFCEWLLFGMILWIDLLTMEHILWMAIVWDDFVNRSIDNRTLAFVWVILWIDLLTIQHILWMAIVWDDFVNRSIGDRALAFVWVDFVNRSIGDRALAIRKAIAHCLWPTVLGHILRNRSIGWIWDNGSFGKTD